MNLNERLKLFLDSGQICDKNYNAMLRIISKFDKKWGITLTEDNASMFITHLAMTYERIKNGETLNSYDSNAYKEALENKNIDKCKEAIEDIIKEIKINIPESERAFILIYLCILFENIQD